MDSLKVRQQIVHNLGGEGSNATYGELRTSTMSKIFHSLNKHCHLTSKSHFVDIGCGLGKPIVMAMELGIDSITGIEVSNSRLKKCESLVDYARGAFGHIGNVQVMHTDISSIT